MRIVPLPPGLLMLWLALALLVVTCSRGEAGPALRIATWNLEHLDDSGKEGCLPRDEADYDALAARVNELRLDIVAFQEVENDDAARRVFREPDWQVEVSSRPETSEGRECRRRRGRRLGHLATGFAVRRGVHYQRNGDFRALGEGRSGNRWGTDITVVKGERRLRLLSVHLATGCWGEEHDRNPQKADSCGVLGDQMRLLKKWAGARNSEGTAFVILGDFNRRLGLAGDWAWKTLVSAAGPGRPVLATAGHSSHCSRRFPALIDHLVVGGGAQTFLVPGSLREWPRRGRHPDHCAVSADFRL